MYWLIKESWLQQESGLALEDGERGKTVTRKLLEKDTWKSINKRKRDSYFHLPTCWTLLNIYFVKGYLQVYNEKSEKA